MKKYSGEPTHLQAEKKRLSKALENGEASLRAARLVLDQHDHFLRRGGQKSAIADAHEKVENGPGEIDDLKVEISDVEKRMRDREARLAQAREVEVKRPQLLKQFDEAVRRLDEDRDLRSDRLRQNPSEQIIGHLGKRPKDNAIASKWDKAAGQLDQHHAAFDQDQLSGAGKTEIDQSGVEHSQQLSLEAFSALQPASRRQRMPRRTLQREAPGR